MGWHSFDQSLLKAFKEEIITPETALMFCTHKNKMRRDIDMEVKLRDQCTKSRRACGWNRMQPEDFANAFQ